MKILGLLLALLGWLIAVLSLSMSSSNTARLILTLVGILVSVVGVLGVLNRAYLQDAIWKR